MGIMLLASGHVAGWPSAKGGSQAIADSMAKALAEAGGTIETGRPVRTLDDIPPSKAVLFDLSPRQVLDRSEEHTSELQSLMRISYSVLFLKNKNKTTEKS